MFQTETWNKFVIIEYKSILMKKYVFGKKLTLSSNLYDSSQKLYVQDLKEWESNNLFNHEIARNF